MNLGSLQGFVRRLDHAPGHVLALAVMCFSLLILPFGPATSPAWSKVYKWTDEKGVLHIKDYPSPTGKGGQPDSDKPGASGAKTRSMESTPSRDSGLRDEAGVRSRATQSLLEAVESGFGSAKSEALANLFRYPEMGSGTVAEGGKESIQRFLARYFHQFGPSGNFKRANRPADMIALGQITSIRAGDVEKIGCVSSYYEFLAPLRKGSGSAVVRMTVCEADGEAHLVEMTLGLGDLSPDVAVKTKAFAAASVPQEGVRMVNATSQAPDGKAVRNASQESGKVQPSPRPVPRMRVQPREPGAMVPFPAHFMSLIGFLTGTVLLVYLAIWLCLVFFMSLCLYLIARKLKVRAAWLSWIPVANIHTMVASAGKPWTWTALFLMPLVLGCLMPLFPAMGLVLIGFFLVNLVMLALMWMAMCQRLGKNKWLGLLIFVPLANMVLPAYLAFKREPQPATIAMGRILMWTTAAYVLCLGIIWSVVSFGVMPLFMRSLQSMNHVVPSMPSLEGLSSPGSGAHEQGDPNQAGGASEQIETLTEAQYDALLQGTKVAFDSPSPNVSVGPVFFQMDKFWEGTGAPHLWIKIKMAPLPVVHLFKSSVVEIGQVLDRSGQDVYDSQSSFETEFFRSLSLSQNPGPPVHLEAIRSVHLKPGVKEADIREIRGTLIVKLPLDIQTIDLGPKDLKSPRELAGTTITLKAFSDREIQLHYAGAIDSVLAVLAQDDQGGPVPASSSSWTTPELGARGVTYTYDRNVFRVRCLLAGELKERRYPFTLRVE